MSKNSNEQNQIAQKLMGIGIAKNSAYILSSFFESDSWKVWDLSQNLRIGGPQCYTSLSWLKKKQWIGSFQTNCGQRRRPEKVYYLKKEPKEILHEICQQCISTSYLERIDSLLLIVRYLSEYGKVSTRDIGDSLQINRYILQKVLTELKKRDWIKETRPIHGRKDQSECQLITSEQAI
jgi:predicted transcriptional regulator